ncbi:SEM4E protein, partial [Amia calva]|nr:SEM4E protein [Amia calva]
MLLREDQGLLLLGAREAIYALDLDDISRRKSVLTSISLTDLSFLTSPPQTECRNYIRTLHKQLGDDVYVCGTNAFSPTCDVLKYEGGQLKLEGKLEEGKGKCPFDPFQRYSSVMVDGDLYSATSINFLGSEPVVLRSSHTSLRTEFKSSWLNEPNFIYMDVVQESEDNAEGDDDKVYLFFSESAVEYDFYSKLLVSRVARVCKGDQGGQRTLQKKWTSFLKARVDCSVLEPSLPFVVQDVFLLRAPKWKDSVFYGVFTPQSGSSAVSAVCAFSVQAISEVFSKGKYKTPITVETSHVKWVMYSGEVPVPRPGACINNAARKLNMQRSLDLPDNTLQFVRDRPLMNEAVTALGGQPQLVKGGAQLTRIAVDRVRALDSQLYDVMFIGTENGCLLKAVNYDGEMFIVEELQLFNPPEPVKTLRLSAAKGQLYAGSESSAVQVPVSECGRYKSCVDCLLARDPYCGWDRLASRCALVSSGDLLAHTSLIQSVRHGNASQCTNSMRVQQPQNYTLVPGNNIKLVCHPGSNLAQVHWQFNGHHLPGPSSASNPGSKYYFYSEGLLVFNVSAADVGEYTCRSLERANGQQYALTEAVYRLQLVDRNLVPSLPAPRTEERALVALQVAVGLLAALLVALLVWNLYRGHIPLPGRGAGVAKPRGVEGSRLQGAMVDNSTHRQVPFQAKVLPEEKSQVDGSSCQPLVDNYRSLTNGEPTPSPCVPLDGFKYIDDESEI